MSRPRASLKKKRVYWLDKLAAIDSRVDQSNVKVLSEKEVDFMEQVRFYLIMSIGASKDTFGAVMALRSKKPHFRILVHPRRLTKGKETTIAHVKELNRLYWKVYLATYKENWSPIEKESDSESF